MGNIITIFLPRKKFADVLEFIEQESIRKSESKLNAAKLVKQPERKKLTVDNMPDNNLDSKTGDDEIARGVADPLAPSRLLGKQWTMKKLCRD